MNMSHNKKQEQDIYQTLIFKGKKKKIIIPTDDSTPSNHI